MGELIKTILETIWLLVPAGVANMAPVFAAEYNWLPALSQPIHQRLLGSHKTWRGVVVGIFFGSITGLILGQGILFGAVVGLGALVGDAAKSFFKRRLNIAPGSPWPVFDQTDYVVGALIAVSLFFPLTFFHIVIALAVFPCASLLTSVIGKNLKIKKSL